jgi:hypothetical protein
MSKRVDAVFAFKALSYGVVGLLAFRVLALSLISLRRDIRSGRPLTGLVRFALVIAVFSVLVTLYTAYIRLPMSLSASRTTKASHHVDTADACAPALVPLCERHERDESRLRDILTHIIIDEGNNCAA